MPTDGKTLAAQFTKINGVLNTLREQLIKKAHLKIPASEPKFDAWIESIAQIAKKLRDVRKVETVLRHKSEAHPYARDYAV